MKTCIDYLEYYNNNDIEPFTKSMEYMRKFFKEYNLDMFKDGISVPGLSLKIIINESLKGFDEYKKQLPPKPNKNIEVSIKAIEEKINNYKKQDLKAKRSIKNYI